MKLFLNYLLVFMLLVCCSEDRFVPGSRGRDYFPLQTGDFKVYQVSQTTYTQGQDPMSETFQLMTEVIDSFPSAEDEVTYVIQRMKRYPGASTWEIVDTWSARLTLDELVVSEGNVPFVKLIFPPADGVGWDGNKLNNHAEDQYQITSVGQPLELNGLPFEETVTVLQENNDDRIVYYDFREEKYARGVGLVSSVINQLQYCTLDDCLAQQIVNSGIEYRQEIIDYGSN